MFGWLIEQWAIAFAHFPPSHSNKRMIQDAVRVKTLWLKAYRYPPAWPPTVEGVEPRMDWEAAVELFSVSP